MDPNSPPEAKGNRGRGWMLVVLGPVLSIAMAVISFYLWRIIYYPGQPGGHSRWTGSHEMTVNAFSLFATIFVFGIVCTGAGAFMIRTGRKNIVLIVVIVLLGGVMIYFGNGIMQTPR
jgi:magnesium-transporting ATPase (P-type)